MQIEVFQLPLLPSDDKKIFTKEVLLFLAKAHRSLGKLEELSKKLANPLMLVNTISLQEAKSSYEIENIFKTDDELYKQFPQRTHQFHQQRKKF